MTQPTITAGEITLRPFTEDDVSWVYEVSLDLGLIEWRAEVGNTASRRVAEKAGFTVEAVLWRRLVHRGTRVDAWIGSMLPDELGDPDADDTPGVGSSGEGGLG